MSRIGEIARSRAKSAGTSFLFLPKIKSPENTIVTAVPADPTAFAEIEFPLPAEFVFRDS
jgi:hypothetical protein